KLRVGLAQSLIVVDEYAEAKQQLAIIQERAQRDDALRVIRPLVLEQSARAAFGLGDVEQGVRLIDEAVEGYIEHAGNHTWDTERARSIALGFQIELGHLDDAEHRLAILEQSYRSHPKEKHEFLAGLDVDRSEIASLRGDFPRAEALARGALAALEEMHAVPS